MSPETTEHIYSARIRARAALDTEIKCRRETVRFWRLVSPQRMARHTALSRLDWAIAVYHLLQWWKA